MRERVTRGYGRAGAGPGAACVEAMCGGWGGNPIELAWAVQPKKPSLFESIMGKQEEAAVFTEVPADAPFDAGLSCGFLGTLAREYRGGGVSARYERIVIGKPPEVPLRDPSQAKYDATYAKRRELGHGPCPGC